MPAKRCCLGCGGWSPEPELKRIPGAGWLHRDEAGCSAYLAGMRSEVGRVRDRVADERRQRDLQAEREPETAEGWG